MADWILIPCLVRLRAEFNLIAPDRDRASDGSIGDTAHAGGGTSDHLPDEEFPALRGKDADSRNEVHAIDVDEDLRTPGLTMELVVQHLIARCRAGLEDRLRYIIFNRRIWSGASGWRLQAYDGANPHAEHAHFSASYSSAAEADTHSWHLEDLVAFTKDDAKLVVDELMARKIVDANGVSLGSYGGLQATMAVRLGALANSMVPGIARAVAEIAAEELDADVLAAKIAAKLPPDPDDVTAEELQAAIVAAARELIAAPAG